MEIFKPSIAKILSIPVIFLFFLLLVWVLINFFFPSLSIDSPTAVIIYFVCLFLISYILSGIIWYLGKNHRRILILVFTVGYMFTAYFVVSLIISFFGLCLTDLGLPCGGDFAPCPSSPPIQSCGLSPQLTYLTWTSYGAPILFLIIGILLFVKEGKNNTSKK